MWKEGLNVPFGRRKPLTPVTPSPSGSAKIRVPQWSQVRRGIVLSFHVPGFPRVTFTASARYIDTGTYAAP
jgi:hypothetical protein